ARWLRSLYQPRNKPYRKKRSDSVHLMLENLEDRTVPSTLPPALVSGQANLPGLSNPALNGFGPSVAQDPVNPLKMFEVHNGTTVINGVRVGKMYASYTINGGQTWTTLSTPSPLLDPPANPP